MAIQKFRIKTEQLASLSKFVDSDCNEIMFVNVSQINTCTVENFPLAPGAFLSIDGNADEKDVTTYRVIQQTIGDLWIIRKCYVKE